MDELRAHSVRLADGAVVLRPLTEQDWDLLMAWNSDPEVFYFADWDAVAPRSLDEVKAIYRQVSRVAYCFIIERDGVPVGDCWLQQMNLDRLRARFPGLDCRRIDLQLARDAWGQGLGGACVRLLTAFAFDRDGADAVFGCDIASDNSRSLRLFEREGFSLVATNPQPSGVKSAATYDLARFRRPRSP